MKPELSEEDSPDRRLGEKKLAEFDRALASEVRVVESRVGKKRSEE